MLDNKRAQGKIILLLFAIGLFIVIYLVALPISERCKLLPDLPDCVPTKNLTIILNATPGVLVPQEKVQYSLQPIELFSYESLNFPLTIFPQTLERSWFYEKTIKQEFSLHERIKDAKVFIYVTRVFGSLDVYVNNKKIKTIREKGYYLASIPANILNRTNSLKVVPSLPWLPFLINSIDIDSIIVKEVYFITQDTITKAVTIEQNLSDIKKAQLSFEAECFSQDALKVIWNGQTLADKQVCNVYEINLTDKLEKENTLTFYSSGNYLIKDIKIAVETKEKQYPIYFFSLYSEQIASIKNGTFNAAIYLTFPSLESKEFDIYLNSFKIPISTTSPLVRTAVNYYIREGQNVLYIIPKKTFTLSSLVFQLE